MSKAAARQPKVGEIVLYKLPGEVDEIRPLVIVRVWPNEFGDGLHGVNGTVLLDGANDAKFHTGLNQMYVYSAKPGVAQGEWQFQQ